MVASRSASDPAEGRTRVRESASSVRVVDALSADGIPRGVRFHTGQPLLEQRAGGGREHGQEGTDGPHRPVIGPRVGIFTGAGGYPVGMRTFSAATAAPPEVAWRLLARPADWGRWSPHVRGAWGLGDPEVREGARGAARLLGVVPLPAQVVAKRAGRSWTWRVGAVELVHRVEPRAGGGATVAIDLRAPGPLEPALAAAYGPLIEVSLHRLAQEAERVVGTPAR